jgi:hypothetical protein
VQVSVPLQMPSPQFATQSPQSSGQVEQVSPGLHTVSPQTGPPVPASGPTGWQQPPTHENPLPQLELLLHCTPTQLGPLLPELELEPPVDDELVVPVELEAIELLLPLLALDEKLELPLDVPVIGGEPLLPLLLLLVPEPVVESVEPEPVLLPVWPTLLAPVLALEPRVPEPEVEPELLPVPSIAGQEATSLWW